MMENPGGSMLPPSSNFHETVAHYRRAGDHLSRYLFVRSFCRGARVLDFGCGFGVGAVILSDAYSSYLGVDVDASALEFAKRVIQPHVPRARFEHPRELASTVSGQGSRFDVVVSLEVIEHLRDPETLVQRLRDLVEPEGVVILSTPNGKWTGHHPESFWNRFHIDEYTIPELGGLLRPHFARIDWFGQFRVDQVDRIYSALARRSRFRSGVEESGSSAGYHGRRGPTEIETPACTARLRGKVLGPLFHRFANPAGVYRVRPLSERDLTKQYFGTIVAVARA